MRFAGVREQGHRRIGSYVKNGATAGRESGGLVEAARDSRSPPGDGYASLYDTSAKVDPAEEPPAHPSVETTNP
jgi:hypothetical protein